MAVYYVDKDNGKELASGLSPENAVKDYLKF